MPHAILAGVTYSEQHRMIRDAEVGTETGDLIVRSLL